MQVKWEDIKAQAVRRVTLGKGGADVYELTEERIAKYICRSALERGEAWEQYAREAQFYATRRGENHSFLPEILQCDQSDDEILIVMRKYAPLCRDTLDDALLRRILHALAQIHALPAELTPATPQIFSDEDIAKCLSGWRSVLEEHGAEFDQQTAEAVAAAINDVNRWHFSKRQCLCHGDFHFDNLLADAEGNVIACDWQNVCCAHPASDIAFLLSRLAADGCEADRNRVISMYCECTGSRITPEEIDAQMRLSALNTAFAFWHYFLHGAAAEAVRDIYDQMAADIQALQNRQ